MGLEDNYISTDHYMCSVHKLEVGQCFGGWLDGWLGVRLISWGRLVCVMWVCVWVGAWVCVCVYVGGRVLMVVGSNPCI